MHPNVTRLAQALRAAGATGEPIQLADSARTAAGHPHAVFPTTYEELVRLTGGTPTTVAHD